MLVSTVLLPESFSVSHFADPTYHLNMEVFLRGVDTNGLILIDAEKRLYDQMCNNVETLANNGKAKATLVLFEELLKKNRQKTIRFVTTTCSCNQSRQLTEVAANVATVCEADSLLADPTTLPQLAAATNGTVPVVQITDYIHSALEAERRRRTESLTSLDQMAPGEFDNHIIDATRFSRWIRFYDKQIGKAKSLNRFRRGIERILELWVQNAHFPKSELSAVIYTVVDESPRAEYQPPVAYQRVNDDLAIPLHQRFGIPIDLFFKRDADAKCHPRHLQTQSVAIMFEKGFDILLNDNSFCRTFITIGGDYAPHLKDFRGLQNYVPPKNIAGV